MQRLDVLLNRSFGVLGVLQVYQDSRTASLGCIPAFCEPEGVYLHAVDGSFFSPFFYISLSLPFSARLFGRLPLPMRTTGCGNKNIAHCFGAVQGFCTQYVLLPSCAPAKPRDGEENGKSKIFGGVFFLHLLTYIPPHCLQPGQE